MQEQSEYPELPETVQKTLKGVILSGLAGLVIPLVLGGYVLIRIQMLDHFEATPEHLSPILMTALYSLIILPISMALAFFIAFFAGVKVRRSFWFNLKESFAYGFAIPRFVLSAWTRSGI